MPADVVLDVYDLSVPKQAKLARAIEIDEVQWVKDIRPTGLAFSEGGDRIAILLEHKRNAAMLLCWGEDDDEIPLHQHVYAGGIVPAGVDPKMFRGERFGLLDQGRAWIVDGASVFDAASDRLLGRVGIRGVRAQKVTRPDTVMLMQGLEMGATLLEVRLDLNDARGALTGRIPRGTRND